jgi:NAD(P) transhydrogenase subunit beta
VSVPLATTFLQEQNFLDILYIIAFGLFIQGLRGLSGPTTAVRGNRIAAVGMAVAVIATLLNSGEGNWALIVIGVALGTAVGVPAARQVKMTAMPQMVALFNGVGGGAVFLISWSEFRLTDGYSNTATYIAVFSLFAAIVGSVSFWGSNIAFGKLQEIIPGKPITLGSSQQFVNLLLLLIALACGVAIAAGEHPEVLFIVLLLSAALLGNAVVLPIGGADMPVVISLLNAFTGLSAAATGIALDNTALIVAGMIVGASGTILTNLMATAMNRSIPAIIAGGFGGGGAVEGASGAGEHAGTVRSTSAADAAIQLAYANRVVIVPGYGMAVAQAQHAVRELTKELEKRQVEVSYAIHPVAGRPPRVPAHRRVAGDRRQRRDQPGRQEQPVLADLRHADPRGRRQPVGDRDQALDEPGLCRDRERAVLRPEDDDAVRGREVGGERDHRRARQHLTLCETAAR